MQFAACWKDGHPWARDVAPVQEQPCDAAPTDSRAAAMKTHAALPRANLLKQSPRTNDLKRGIPRPTLRWRAKDGCRCSLPRSSHAGPSNDAGPFHVEMLQTSGDSCPSVKKHCRDVSASTAKASGTPDVGTGPRSDQTQSPASEQDSEAHAASSSQPRRQPLRAQAAAPAPVSAEQAAAALEVGGAGPWRAGGRRAALLLHQALQRWQDLDRLGEREAYIERLRGRLSTALRAQDQRELRAVLRSIVAALAPPRALPVAQRDMYFVDEAARERLQLALQSKLRRLFCCCA